MRLYVFLWLLITAFLGFEYWALSNQPASSLLILLQKNGILSSQIKLSTIPGRTLSLWLGWIGFSLMVFMNLYSMRKRFDFMKNWGRLTPWLNFHIFCGILGPTLIFFHCGLKVRGLVGISFWSMVISFTSGIIGRYFFVQLSSQRQDFETLAQAALNKLNRIFEKKQIQVDPEKKNKVLKLSLLHAGAHISNSPQGLISTFLSSLEGDLRLLFSDLAIPRNWPIQTRKIVTLYALNTRRAQTLASFEKLMGYWHAFHFPFAIFMYIAAVIHIISSLIFQGVY